VQSPNVTDAVSADAVVEDTNVLSPLYVAVRDAEPIAVGVHEHDAALLDTATFTQPVMFDPFTRNVTVPVAVAVTAAVIVAAYPFRGLTGAVTVIVEDFLVVPVTTDVVGLLLAPESTAETRKSYCVSASSPVTVSLKSAALAASLQVVHEESADFLYSNL